mgnify:CR=1 FL=1
MKYISTPVVTTVSLTIPLLIFSLLMLFAVHSTVLSFLVVLASGALIGLVMVMLEDVITPIAL